MSWEMQWLAFCNQGLAHPLLDALMVALSLGAMPLGALAPLVVWLAGRRRVAGGLLITLAVSTLLAVVLQCLLDRPRPISVRLVLPLSAFPSFPSGHAAAAFGGAAFITLVWRRAGPLFLSGAALVSFSRLYLGQHFPGDVLAGALLGVGVAVSVYGGYLCPGHGRRPRWAWLLWCQVALVFLVSLSAYLGLLRLDALGLPGTDKALHFLLAGGLAFFALAWWPEQRPVTVLAALVVVAAVEEGLQALSPLRTFDLGDLAAGLAGIGVAGWLGVRWIYRPGVSDSASLRQRVQ